MTFIYASSGPVRVDMPKQLLPWIVYDPPGPPVVDPEPASCAAISPPDDDEDLIGLRQRDVQPRGRPICIFPSNNMCSLLSSTSTIVLAAGNWILHFSQDSESSVARKLALPLNDQVSRTLCTEP